ncbi:TPA: shikimate kinase II, partial [Klebsiella pneumoniae]|nr:shikimate kinase II [Klebsiella pneumoniae]
VREEVGEVLAQREALYRDAAHHIVDATASPDRVVEQIMSMLCSATATPVS